MKHGLFDRFRHARAGRLAELKTVPGVDSLADSEGHDPPGTGTPDSGPHSAPDQSDESRRTESAVIRELRDTIEDLQTHSSALVVVLDTQARKLVDMEALATRQKERIVELEAARESPSDDVEVLAEALRLSGVAALKVPSVKKLLLDRYHPDKHPRAGEAEREECTVALQKINAAYEVLSRHDRERSPFH